MGILTPTAELAIRGICAEHASFKLVAVGDVIENYRAGIVTIGDLSAYLDRVEKDGTKAHWFTPKAGSAEAADANLEHDAFVLGRVGSQSMFQVKYGEEAARAAAERYENPFARGIIGKPGVAPEATTEAKKDRSTNPFSMQCPGCYDPLTGRVTAKGITEQGKLSRALGEVKAADIASRVGGRLGQTHAPDFKKRVA